MSYAKLLSRNCSWLSKKLCGPLYTKLRKYCNILQPAQPTRVIGSLWPKTREPLGTSRNKSFSRFCGPASSQEATLLHLPFIPPYSHATVHYHTLPITPDILWEPSLAKVNCKPRRQKVVRPCTSTSYFASFNTLCFTVSACPSMSQHSAALKG